MAVYTAIQNILLVSILFFSALVDLRTMQIPDEASLAICILAVGAGGFSVWRVCFAIMLLLFSGMFMGLGDAKLFGSLALLFGGEAFCIFASSIVLAGATSFIRLILKQTNLKESFAFAPYICVSVCSLCLNKVLYMLQ